MKHLDLATKHKAYLGFCLGAKTVMRHLTLAKIEPGLIFTVYADTDVGKNHIHVGRILINGRWVEAMTRPYRAGQEAGEVAASWWKREGFVGGPAVLGDIDIDPDFEKWMADAAA